jgi:hypothetical protein
MSSIVQELISLIVPCLIQEAESLLKINVNPKDPSWVAGMINEIVVLLQKWIPGWLMPSVQEVEQLVAAEIEKLI